MKKFILLLVSSLLLTGLSYGQQDPLYSQYINNPMVINPAYAGLNNNLNASLSYRTQWGGFEGNPTTVNVNGHISLVDNRVGAGLLIVQDKIGNAT
ncbi:MAG TPA: PorP/SprF family type IX secretion system membrane protein, partial [Cyclobacteriaceae bacterium]|nr:PorP/SprF family type IX secretion system membrane protein [Cyclobacteriaceae bacterium]